MPAARDKSEYFEKFIGLCAQYPNIILVLCDNIGSQHMARIRRDLRGKATLLMGKNTMMRKAIRMNREQYPDLEYLLPHLVGNVGLIFCESDLREVKKIVTSTRVPAAAKSGAIAPNAVVIEKQQTSLPPAKTSYLQALGIASKINKGTIEITQDVNLIEEGDKVGASQADLLQLLNVKPFSYGLEPTRVYEEGQTYPAMILDITDEDIVQYFSDAVNNIAIVSLAASFPTLAAVPHMVVNAFKNLVAIAVETEYTFPEAENIKEIITNPEAFAAAQASSAPAAAAEEEAKEEEEEEESDDMGFDLFG